MYPIRNTVKCLVVSGNHILLNRNINNVGTQCYGIKKGDIYFDLPGGGQNRYENLRETAKRECFEETGYAIEADSLLGVYEEIYLNSEYRMHYEKYSHRVYFIFRCHLLNYEFSLPPNKDEDILTSEWIHISRLKRMPFYPSFLRQQLPSLINTDSCFFWDVNYVNNP